jgi:hypothetical protein
MALIFISHSSLDKIFAKKLSKDLISFSHEPWLDEWEIKVGECIPTKIETGLKNCDYILVILSKNSIKSSWVEREWKAKYWEEANKGKINILPVLIEDCEIPILLQTKKYADFRTNYQVGIVTLINSITPSLNRPQTLDISIGTNKSPANSISITDLLAKLHNTENKLSILITEILAFAVKENKKQLKEFCIRELTGWEDGEHYKFSDSDYSFRLMPCYISNTITINFQFEGWNFDPEKVFDHLKKHKDKFLSTNLFCGYSISKLEAQPLPMGKAILTFPVQASLFFKKGPKGREVDAYAKEESYVNLLENVRTELVKRLTALL